MQCIPSHLYFLFSFFLFLTLLSTFIFSFSLVEPTGCWLSIMVFFYNSYFFFPHPSFCLSYSTIFVIRPWLYHCIPPPIADHVSSIIGPSTSLAMNRHWFVPWQRHTFLCPPPPCSVPNSLMTLSCYHHPPPFFPFHRDPLSTFEFQLVPILLSWCFLSVP